MGIAKANQIWRQKLQENSSIWGSLFLWFCSVIILLMMMVSFARG